MCICAIEQTSNTIDTNIEIETFIFSNSIIILRYETPVHRGYGEKRRKNLE